jgi:hypothetical protein
VELFEPRRLTQLPGKRMLASARADEEHLHTRTLASVNDGFESVLERERREAMLEPDSRPSTADVPR